MKITFDYKDPFRECFEETWGGCCCHCKSHMEVHKHCCHSPKPKGREGDCVCEDSLGFYVCTVFANMGDGETDKAHLSGKHGFCELFVRRTSKQQISCE